MKSNVLPSLAVSSLPLPPSISPSALHILPPPPSLYLSRPLSLSLFLNALRWKN